MSAPACAFTVAVPNEAGQIGAVEVVHDPGRDTYTVAFSGELVDGHTEALTVAVQLALLTVRGWHRRAAA